MKITGKKNIEAERLRGRAAVDAVMVPRINAAMGPKFALYQAKAAVAREGSNMFGKPSDIIKRHNLLLSSIIRVEEERQALQARIDAATSASEIDAIVASL
ncbi:hypothetical protein QFZ34_002045 [Phyllobacterium ifriqiyense]|uniref:Uncharacterized protein n=1 Tax=Phyllobacterium ifriqiyense TaxID=314238 RepID=A0ABU0SAW0_9HYPH|nr:hypothetical protein [Phyllobacterium ifriqiyense]MDQ0996863.1 hypothetical protein [Phyllobacterium ifriqiyense]